MKFADHGFSCDIQVFTGQWFRQETIDHVELFALTLGIDNATGIIVLPDRAFALRCHSFQQFNDHVIIATRTFTASTRDHVPVVHGAFYQAQSLRHDTV
eukprot:CAMPEP_0195270158 /NCGR_PEP_ID=MMETSP0706-20130129/14179_1 /TAXON_ID=33640 /ORGANISM="Asterionellopsis glacialis, Strain CCMP134" /LENGTH=98 /DNA_ID=CAMNT_0040325367 /DNA_START=142 /DNA_END=438 /DNA_ORIENTATION=+